MLKHLRRLLGDSTPDGAMRDRGRARAPLRDESDEDRASSENLLTTSVLGQTLVATVIDSDLTAPKVAELSVLLQERLTRTPGARNLVLDLQNVEYLDSACLNFFVELLSRVKAKGGRIGVAAVAQRVEVLFKLTRLDLVFSIRRNVMDAIEAVEREQ